MIIRYNGKDIETDNLELLGGNLEGQVYAYEDDAIKVYHEKPQKILMPETDCQKLTLLKTKRILLPKAIAYKYDKNGLLVYGGYVSEKKSNLIPIKDLIKHLPDIIRQESEYYDEDLDILAKNDVSISDLACPGNLISDGQAMYFCDPGNFTCNNSINVARSNLEHLNQAFHSQLFVYGRDQESLEEEFEGMFNYEYMFSPEFYDFIVALYSNAYETDFETSNYKNYLYFLEDILVQYNSIEDYKREVLAQAIDSGLYDYRYPDELEELERILH